MRALMTLVAAAALLTGCSQTPEAKKVNNEASQAIGKTGEKLKEAANAAADAAVKESKAVGQEIEDASKKLKEGIDKAADEAEEATQRK
jgi:hypothetical protein